MLILHLSTNPPRRAPSRFWRAFSTQPGVQARRAVFDDPADLCGKVVFDLDLRWPTDQEEALHLYERCDVRRRHRFIDRDSKAFAPVDLLVLWQHGERIVRTFFVRIDHAPADSTRRVHREALTSHAH